jgi:hypothetical protein
MEPKAKAARMKPMVPTPTLSQQMILMLTLALAEDVFTDNEDDWETCDSSDSSDDDENEGSQLASQSETAEAPADQSEASSIGSSFLLKLQL